MIYFPENFGEQIEQFEKLIVLDKRYAEPKIGGKGSFSKFVRVCMLVYIKQRNKELMQEKELGVEGDRKKLNLGAPSNATSNKNSY